MPMAPSFFYDAQDRSQGGFIVNHTVAVAHAHFLDYRVQIGIVLVTDDGRDIFIEKLLEGE